MDRMSRREKWLWVAAAIVGTTAAFAYGLTDPGAEPEDRRVVELREQDQ